MYHVTSYGADPTGKIDSTESLLRALSDVYNSTSEGSLIDGVRNLGGAQINLDGGNFLISRPLRLPGAFVGNVMVRIPAPDYRIHSVANFIIRKKKKEKLN